MKTEEAALTVAGIASKTTYSGAGITIGGFLLTNEFAVLVGILAAVGGFLVNWYYKRQAIRLDESARSKAEIRAEQLHQLRVDYLRNGRNPVTDFGGLGDDD